MLPRHTLFLFFLIGNTRIIIDEKGKRNIQCVHENEHSKAKNKNPTENNQETKLREEKN